MYVDNVTGEFPVLLHTVSSYLAQGDVQRPITTHVMSEAVEASKVLQTQLVNFRSEASALAKLIVYWCCDQIRTEFLRHPEPSRKVDDPQLLFRTTMKPFLFQV